MKSGILGVMEIFRSSQVLKGYKNARFNTFDGNFRVVSMISFQPSDVYGMSLLLSRSVGMSLQRITGAIPFGRGVLLSYAVGSGWG